MRLSLGFLGAFLCVLGVSFTLYTRAFSVAALPVRVQAEQFKVGGHNFWIHGINYYPQRTPWSLFWTQYNPEVTQADLRRVRAMGFNTVRIFLPYPQFQPPFTAQHTPLVHLNHFLKQAESEGLRCVITLFDFYGDYRRPELAARYVQALLPRYRHHPAILAWDLKNELDRDAPGVGAETLQQWLNTVIPALRKADETHLLTVGWSTPEAAVSWQTAVDYDTFHYYGRPTDFSPRLEALRAQRALQGYIRPLVMGEFGYHTWAEAPQDPHLLPHQYNDVNALMAGRLSQGLAGSLFWNLYDYAPTLREPWVLQAPSFQYYMGLLDLQGQPKPALQALQQRAFLRDAYTLGEITLQSKALEMVLWAEAGGEVILEQVSGSHRQEVRRWSIEPGLQRLAVPVESAVLAELIALRQRYEVTSPALRNLAGQGMALRREPLTLRLR